MTNNHLFIIIAVILAVIAIRINIMDKELSRLSGEASMRRFDESARRYYAENGDGS